MTRFASGTTVDVARSRVELERVIMRYGCGQFISGQMQDGRALIGFTAHGRQVRLTIAPPDPKEFATTAKGRRRAPGAVAEVLQQEVKRRWRALLLVLKAKFEAVESGIATFEDEFLAYTALPDGSTVGDSIQPMIAEAYTSGRVRALLPQLSGPAR